MNLKENENTKERRRRIPTLHYTTLKKRKPSLLTDLLSFQVSTGLYIGKRSF